MVCCDTFVLIQVHNANSVPGGSAHNATVGTIIPCSDCAKDSTNNTSNHAENSSSTTAAGSTPWSLEQLMERQWLLEKQWEQSSQILMEQAQHFDSKSVSNTPWIPVCCDLIAF
jgi:hypothetical protein